MTFHCSELVFSKCNSSCLVPIKKMLILKFNSSLCLYFFFFAFNKSSLIKSCSSSEDLSECKISWSYVDWCNFCIHLRSLNVRAGRQGRLTDRVVIWLAYIFSLGKYRFKRTTPSFQGKSDFGSCWKVRESKVTPQTTLVSLAKTRSPNSGTELCCRVVNTLTSHSGDPGSNLGLETG
jgi:hypothetical protein